MGSTVRERIAEFTTVRDAPLDPTGLIIQARKELMSGHLDQLDGVVAVLGVWRKMQKDLRSAISQVDRVQDSLDRELISAGVKGIPSSQRRRHESTAARLAQEVAVGRSKVDSLEEGLSTAEEAANQAIAAIDLNFTLIQETLAQYEDIINRSRVATLQEGVANSLAQMAGLDPTSVQIDVSGAREAIEARTESARARAELASASSGAIQELREKTAHTAGTAKAILAEAAARLEAAGQLESGSGHLEIEQ